MKTVGLITEYNPFHEGHRYHIEQAKKISGADTAVVVMSGDFVQRGEPAITDKYTRAHMALSCGADLVVELPALYATASAEGFALGAAGILHFLGVDALCFGSECNDINILCEIAAILAEEPAAFKTSLKNNLAMGDSFPKARQKALEEYMGQSLTKHKDVMSKPNNLLGIEYIKALRRYSSGMEVYTIKRMGQGYNEAKEYKETEFGEGFASAASIRRMIVNGQENEAADMLPDTAGDIFRSAIEKYGIVTADDFSQLLNYKIYCLMREDSTMLLNYSDVSEPIANKITRIYGREHFSGDWSELVMKLKSKELTHSRVNRALLHILLDIKKDAWSLITPYARILGMTTQGQKFLASIRKTCPIPLITKVADDSELLRNDIFAADVYNQVVYRKNGEQITDDYRHPLIKIS